MPMNHDNLVEYVKQLIGEDETVQAALNTHITEDCDLDFDPNGAMTSDQEDLFGCYQMIFYHTLLAEVILAI